MSNRQYIRFYIDRNNNLRAIWYKERKYKYIMSSGYMQADDFTRDMTNEPLYAVRSVRVQRSCDSHLISKVRYCYTEDEAEATIDARLRRNEPARPELITWNHLFMLNRAPHKYVEWFLDFIEETYGEDEREAMNVSLLKAAKEKELRDKWSKEDRTPVTWPFGD